MDKYEYRVKTEQMLEHYEKKQFRKAMEIADTIDWRRVKSPAMLNTVSEIYENNGEFQKSQFQKSRKHQSLNQSWSRKKLFQKNQKL